MFGTFAIRIFFSKSYSGLIKKEVKMQGDLKKTAACISQEDIVLTA